VQNCGPAGGKGSEAQPWLCRHHTNHPLRPAAANSNLPLTPWVVRVKMQNSWLSLSTSGIGGRTCSSTIDDTR
jgi:hypothetical protein